MIPYKQLHRHDPDAGKWGDCGRTVIACLLDIPPLVVPHFWHGGDRAYSDPNSACKAWLADRGYVIYDFPIKGDTWGVDDVLGYVGNNNPDMYWCLLGKSRTGVNHIVICRGDEIVHDPSRVNAGIVGPTVEGDWWIIVVARSL